MSVESWEGWRCRVYAVGGRWRAIAECGTQNPCLPITVQSGQNRVMFAGLPALRATGTYEKTGFSLELGGEDHPVMSCAKGRGIG